MAKRKDDWAIVVGLQDYAAPELPSLQAPENDARDFAAWLSSSKGGNIHSNNVELILSSDYKRPFKNAHSAKPAAQRIVDEFEKLLRIAETNLNNGLGARIGRRLYIFFAGHGCAPQSDREEALLLTAKFSSIVQGENVPGKLWAEHFSVAGYFDEVVLIMDCCRDVFASAPVNTPSGRLRLGPVIASNPQVFYAFATKWSGKAREKPINGRWQGVMTTAILQGLRGAATDEHNNVTAHSLRNYLFNTWKERFTEDELKDATIPKQPDVRFEPQIDMVERNFVFSSLRVSTTFPVTIAFPPTLAGSKVELFDGQFQLVQETTANAAWQVNLKPGKYGLFAATGVRHPFTVSGIGAQDVNFPA